MAKFRVNNNARNIFFGRECVDQCEDARWRSGVHCVARSRRAQASASAASCCFRQRDLGPRRRGIFSVLLGV